ncbi:MAG: GDSL family lipase [Ruminococcus sp.]|nr:GDSL family lipase [Ruminococcus sp.]
MKKRIAAFLAAAAVSSAALAAAVYSASRKYTEKDLKDMRDSLLGEAPVAEGQDINNDGHVDVFDMIRMRRAVVSAAAHSEKVSPVTEEYVRYTGRVLYKDGTAWLVQSGSAVEFTVSASSASVTLRGDASISSAKDFRSRYAVIVDGVIIRDDVMSSTSETVELFSGNTERIASVKVIHLSEADNGAVGISAVTTESSAAEPVVPAKEKELRIEFIGDSITCAYGVEAASQDEHFKTTTENFMKSYAYLTAEELGADYSAVCYSGHGIISGYSADGSKVAGRTVPPYYQLVGSLKAYSSPWDFSAKPCDVIVLNLGTNDSTYIDRDPDSRGAEFISAYEDFLGVIRDNNPHAYIICTLGIMGCTSEYQMIEKAVENYRAKTGDNSIMCYLSPTQSYSDGYGADWHPSEATHKINAEILADKIRTVLGLNYVPAN